MVSDVAPEKAVAFVGDDQLSNSKKGSKMALL
jgi:hypothetical protein